jgi:hypothetical protein
MVRAAYGFYIVNGRKYFSTKITFFVVFFPVSPLTCTITIVNENIYSKSSRWYSECSGTVNPGRIITKAANV